MMRSVLVLFGICLGLLEAIAAVGEMPRLVDAARHGDAEALRAQLEAGASVDATAADGMTALHWACYRDDADAADLLLRAGADVDAATDLGVTPLWLASQNGSAAMVERLLADGADPNSPLLRGETPVMVAARSGNPDVVKQLLANGGDVGARAARGQTALMWAVAQQHAPVVDVFLAHGTDVHARSEVWSQVMAVPPHGRPEHNRVIPHGGNTALMFAARVGDLASAKLLVAAGANVNDTDAGGVSAMVLAAHAGHAALVDFLLDKGADPNASAAGFSALHVAIMRRDDRLVTVLLAHGADPNIPLRTWTPTRRNSQDWYFAPALVGASPFWLASRIGESSLMRRLVQHGADPLFVHRTDYVSHYREPRRIEATTALMAAVGMGGGQTFRAWVPPDHERGGPETRALEAVKLAVQLGVDVNATDVDGRTALDEATALQYTTVVEFLLEHAARPGTTVAASLKGVLR